MPNGIIEGPSPNGSTAFINPVMIGLRYFTVLPTLTNNQLHTLIGDTDGGLYICGADRATKLLRTEEQSPSIPAVSDEVALYAAGDILYNQTNTKTVATVFEVFANSYGGADLMVKLTSTGTFGTAIIEIQTSMPTLTTAADYVTIACTSMAFSAAAQSETAFFHLPVGRFYLTINPIGVAGAGNKFVVSAYAVARGLMSC